MHYMLHHQLKLQLTQNLERLVLQTIYVLNKKILQFLGLKFVVYKPEWFQIKSGL